MQDVFPEDSDGDGTLNAVVGSSARRLQMASAAAAAAAAKGARVSERARVATDAARHPSPQARAANTLEIGSKWFSGFAV